MRAGQRVRVVALEEMRCGAVWKGGTVGNGNPFGFGLRYGRMPGGAPGRTLRWGRVIFGARISLGHPRADFAVGDRSAATFPRR